MALNYEPGSADRYIRNRNGETADWAGIAARAALPQSRKYRQAVDETAAGPNLPGAAIFGGLAGSDALFDSQFRQAEAENELANEMLTARGNILNAEAQAAGARSAASAQKKSAIGGAAISIGATVGAALI